MKRLGRIIDEERRMLEELRNVCECELQQAPKGHIKATAQESGYQYYYKKEHSGEANGKYVRKKDMALVREIAKRDYYKKVEEELAQKIKIINKFEVDYKKYELNQIYESMSEGRKQLVEPLVLTDEQYIEKWLDVEYKPKEGYEYSLEIVTDKGELVRSKSEKIIADKLFREGVPYRYEYPLELRGYGTVYPDFCVLNVRERKELYWEHFGMMDDAEYCEKALHKIECYERNGYYPGKNLLITHETGARPVNSQTISDLINLFLL